MTDNRRYAVRVQIGTDEYYYKGLDIWGQDIFGSVEEKQYPTREDADLTAARLNGRVVALAAWRWR